MVHHEWKDTLGGLFVDIVPPKAIDSNFLLHKCGRSEAASFAAGAPHFMNGCYCGCGLCSKFIDPTRQAGSQSLECRSNSSYQPPPPAAGLLLFVPPIKDISDCLGCHSPQYTTTSDEGGKGRELQSVGVGMQLQFFVLFVCPHQPIC